MILRHLKRKKIYFFGCQFKYTFALIFASFLELKSRFLRPKKWGEILQYDFSCFIRYIWPKMSLKRAQTGSKSSPNFNIELRTSRTLITSPKVKLNELEHPKSRTFRTRTQVRSITSQRGVQKLRRLKNEKWKGQLSIWNLETKLASLEHIALLSNF